MKKFISAILSAAVLTASVAVPVLADYTESSYDVEKYDLTFDDGTAINAIDGTAAKATTDTEVVFDASSDTSIFTKEFFWTFDFCFNSAEDGTVPGSISIESKKSSGAVNKQGPSMSYNAGILQTATSKGKQDLGEISPDTWYTMELEGKMVVSGAGVVCRLYSYAEGEKELIQETSALDLRNFYAGSSNGNPNCMKGTNVSFDNIKFISKYPDEIAISATADATEMDAGTTLALDYVAKRLNVEVTKHAVTWSVWDEAGTNEITDESVTISTEGVLAADISVPTQVVTVKATTDVGAEPLTGEYKVTVNAVDTANEKFDTIVLGGPTEMKAGKNVTFTFKASKAGVDVTDTVTEDDVVWSIYNCDDLSQNNNKYINVENGVLTVDDSVIAQDIYVRATSVSGAVYGSKAIKINTSDNQIEKILGANACETAIETAQRVESIDGSAAYLTTSATTLGAGGNQSGYVLSEFDIKFNAEWAGVRIKRNDGKENSSFIYKDGAIQQQTGGSKYSTVVSGITTDKWYHMEILYKSDNASCNIYEYNEDGTLVLIKTAYDLNTRNSTQFAKLEFQTNTYVDNVKMTEPLPTNISINTPGQYMFAGETAQYSAEATRNSLPLKDYADFEWTVLDSSKLPIIDGSITIDSTGLLTSDPMVSEQTVTVKVSAGNASNSAEITIQSSEIFTVTNIGVNEDMTKITKLYLDKNFYWADNVSFVFAIHNADGTLKSVKTLNTFGDRLVTGSNEIAVDYDLPNDFDPQTQTITVLVWTTV